MLQNRKVVIVIKLTWHKLFLYLTLVKIQLEIIGVPCCNRTLASFQIWCSKKHNAQECCIIMFQYNVTILIASLFVCNFFNKIYKKYQVIVKTTNSLLFNLFSNIWLHCFYSKSTTDSKGNLLCLWRHGTNIEIVTIH